MKKLLYITDKDEYIDHSFIGPLFEVYLKKYMVIDIVYFSDFKSEFERKDAHRFTVPSRYKSTLLQELIRNDVRIPDYDFVMVRNNIKLLEHILKYRETYHYKVLYRFSFPKRRVEMSCAKADNKQNILSNIIHHFKIKSEIKTINRCDAWLPTSRLMHEVFFPDVDIPTIICPPAINPQVLQEHTQHSGMEKRFIYSGSLDKLRAFDTVLDAFSKVKSRQWKLFISTRDVEYTYKMLENYPSIRAHIEVYNAKTKDALLDLIAKADIGVALLPDIPIYTSTTPVKIFDYYSSAVPCLMTDAGHVTGILTDSINAWFCDFTQEEITHKIEYLLTLSKEQIMQAGTKGQTHLLSVKNYESLAKTIAQKLEAL